MNPYLLFNYPTLNLMENITASTCKAISYKPIWVKNGKCTNKCPNNFDLYRDKIYIIGDGDINGIIFPDSIKTYDDLPPEPNCKYNSLELINSIYELAKFFVDGNINKQIKSVIKWCEKFGFPFFGDDSIEFGDITTCYKDTGKIGFNFLKFKRDIQILVHATYLSSGDDKTAFINMLNTAILKMKPQYKYIENELVCEMGFSTLISLAFYQLACVHMTPLSNTIKRCKQCDTMFVSNNPQKEYCQKHSPQSHYAQKQRIRAKTDKAPGTN